VQRQALLIDIITLRFELQPINCVAGKEQVIQVWAAETEVAAFTGNSNLTQLLAALVKDCHAGAVKRCVDVAVLVDLSSIGRETSQTSSPPLSVQSSSILKRRMLF
jgi:hypothetical protein